MDHDGLIENAREWIGAAQRVVVLTGAGISTDSGIPDFRGPRGVWTRNPGAEKQSTIQRYLADPEVRRGAPSPISATSRWWRSNSAASCTH